MAETWFVAWYTWIVWHGTGLEYITERTARGGSLGLCVKAKPALPGEICALCCSGWTMMVWAKA